MKQGELEYVMRAVEKHKNEAVNLLQRLVRIPSVNHPPTGDEKEVQQFYYEYLKGLGLETEIFEADDVTAFAEHPGRLMEHDMKGRPVVVGVLKGAGGGKSLMLTAHADVEAVGEAKLWKDNNPFSGKLEGDRIYGRGSADDKSGMAIAAMTAKTLRETGIKLKGDLIIAAVSDEEQAGANGSVLLMCKNYKPDGCLLLDGDEQLFQTANLGGGNCVIELSVPPPQRDAEALLDYFERVRSAIGQFREARQKAFIDQKYYAGDPWPKTAVRITKINLATQTVTEGRFTVWFYLLPGEKSRELKRNFEGQLQKINGQGSFTIKWLSRFIPPSEVSEEEDFARCALESYTTATGRAGRTAGGPMNDMGFLNEYGAYPCIAFGLGHQDRTGSAHGIDEFITVGELMDGIKTTVITAMNWCGYDIEKQINN